jgi:hypothetical protein
MGGAEHKASEDTKIGLEGRPLIPLEISDCQIIPKYPCANEITQSRITS